MRVVFATQRFWPAVSPSIASLDVLARALGKLNVEVSVLTGQWETHWPLELYVRDLHVIRFPLQGWSILNRANLGSRIAHWLQQNADTWDQLVIVGNIEGGEEVFKVAKTLGKPTTVQLFETGPSTLFEDLETQNKHKRKFSKWAEQKDWITIDADSANGICKFNPHANVKIWNLGLGDEPAPSDRQRKELRLALVDTHPVLRGCRYLPLIVYDGPYGDDESTLWLWRMLQQLCSRRRDFRIWLTGDGPGLARLYHSIVADGLEDLILLPGYFPDKDDLFATADLVIMPNSTRVNDYDLVRCISVETPVLMSQPIAQRLNHLLDSQKIGLSNNWNTWVQRILAHLAEPEELQNQIARWKCQLTETNPLLPSINEYLQHLKSLELP